MEWGFSQGTEGVHRREKSRLFHWGLLSETPGMGVKSEERPQQVCSRAGYETRGFVVGGTEEKMWIFS